MSEKIRPDKYKYFEMIMGWKGFCTVSKNKELQHFLRSKLKAFHLINEKGHFDTQTYDIETYMLYLKNRQAYVSHAMVRKNEKITIMMKCIFVRFLKGKDIIFIRVSANKTTEELE